MSQTLKDKIIHDDRRVPRYTSYPTAPHFGAVDDRFSPDDWFGSICPDEPLSLYIHVPFCPQMCYYCGCHTKITHRYAPVEEYLHLVMREAAILSEALGGDSKKIRHIHFGGGSPTMLRPCDFEKLMQRIRESFTVEDSAEIAVEIDPRQLTESHIAAYAQAGVNRVSLGVQDFDQDVLAAVNRVQSFHQSYKAADMLRSYGITAINLDLMYGLPHQTVETVRRAADYAVLFEPSRVALFGYAHVPWMKKHMRLIDESALPDSAGRYDLFQTAADALTAHGYVPVGLDHFVHPHDDMAAALHSKTLKRNFQGYTTDSCAALVGLGLSAISKVPYGFLQNTLDMTAYRKSVLGGRLPLSKHCALSREDQMRAALIEALMCNFEANVYTLCTEYGFDRDVLGDSLGRLQQYESDGFVCLDRASGEIVINPEARQAVRLVCACFDAYLSHDKGCTLHARAV